MKALENVRYRGEDDEKERKEVRDRSDTFKE